MQDFKKFITGPHIEVSIDLLDEKWHIKKGIPAEAGWYYISTDTPLKALQEQGLWASSYTLKSGKPASVKNYDIGKRAKRFTLNNSQYWNKVEVYSGLASNLSSRAHEHTFANPGTGSLALTRYDAIKKYKWNFNYLTLSQFSKDENTRLMLLHLGEQIWRSENGWPILCAE